MPIIGAILFVVLSLKPAMAAVRTHGTIENCVIALGEFCPVESFGFSIVGTLFLTLIVGGVGWLFTSEKRKAAKEQYERMRPAVIASAKRAFFDGDHLKATELLLPLVINEDGEAKRLQGTIRKRADEIEALGQLVEEKRFADAMPLLRQLSQEGEPEAQLLLGVILSQEHVTLETRIQGIEWVMIAAARGSEAAMTHLPRLLESITPLEAHAIREHVKNWIREYEEKKATVIG